VCAGWCGGGAVVIGQVMRGSVARQQVSVAEAGITTARDGDVALGADVTRQPRAVGSLHAAHCHHVDAVRVASHRREALPSHHHHHTHTCTPRHSHAHPARHQGTRQAARLFQVTGEEALAKSEDRRVRAFAAPRGLCHCAEIQ